MKKIAPGKIRVGLREAVLGQCLCGDIRIEIDFPARWAWHDHSAASRHAHGAAYATYVGSWRRRFRITHGQSKITQFEDAASGATRAVQNSYRPASALSHRHRTDAGMDLLG